MMLHQFTKQLAYQNPDYTLTITGAAFGDKVYGEIVLIGIDKLN